MLPTYFLSHGGGPWPWIKQDLGKTYHALEISLQNIPKQLGVTPKAVVMVSGHWEEKDFTVMTHPNPPMFYDYGGFPEHTYHIQYPAPGSPEVAMRMQTLLADLGFPVSLDPIRGFDHGAFAPMAVLFPKANVPLVQLSLRKNLNPKEHLDAGK